PAGGVAGQGDGCEHADLRLVEFRVRIPGRDADLGGAQTGLVAELDREAPRTPGDHGRGLAPSAAAGRNGEGELIGGAGVDPVVEGRVHGGAGRLLVVAVLLRLLARLRTVVVEVGDRPVLCLSLLPGAQAGARVECARRQLQIQTRFL